MFIEVYGKPKEVIIQKWTKKNTWTDIGRYYDNEGFDFLKADNLLSMQQDFSLSNNEFRLILRGKVSKREFQVLSTRAIEFYRLLALMENDNTRHLMCDGLKMFANNENPCVLKLWRLREMIRSAGGIKKATVRPTSKDDGYLETWDVIFNNGEEHTFSKFSS